MYLIALVDDATGRRFGRFVRSDSTAENMNVLEAYLLNVWADGGVLYRQGEPV
ncbi:MAG: hypothetical protein ACR2I2_01005 [Bryobacteraceae bacterium]